MPGRLAPRTAADWASALLDERIAQLSRGESFPPTELHLLHGSHPLRQHVTEAAAHEDRKAFVSRLAIEAAQDEVDGLVYFTVGTWAYLQTPEGPDSDAALFAPPTVQGLSVVTFMRASPKAVTDLALLGSEPGQPPRVVDRQRIESENAFAIELTPILDIWRAA